jgi:hypothetical protein
MLHPCGTLEKFQGQGLGPTKKKVTTLTLKSKANKVSSPSSIISSPIGGQVLILDG